MSPIVGRIVVTAGAVLALGTFMYFTATRATDPILKLVVLLGGSGAMFIMVKGYLFRS